MNDGSQVQTGSLRLSQVTPVLMTLAGDPTAMQLGGITPRTIELAPIIEWLTTTDPLRIVTSRPTQT
ncbi:hypothetical protein GCM10011402_05130 [Paracoccus acridae]|uniref:Uncharacterized protein n=1 Tax=Paracoccus acridae TaxID=1795310 RepID=A0ABQ1VFC6_9RHOB|nr:hypothetical protein [Paracoccus acridae]GGF56134.1 hypothetical protein GCM10011402_05130 [Paracoccus acridae]